MEVNLQPLFDLPIREQTYLDPGYSGHASDVWRVRTDREEVVVRASRLPPGEVYEFWWGLQHLFGVDPRRIHDLEPLNAWLNQVSPIPAPRVLRKGEREGRPFVVVERMPGQPLTHFGELSEAGLEAFGVALARIHTLAFAECGNPAGSFRYPPAEFPSRMVQAFRFLAGREWRDDLKIGAALEPMCREAAALSVTGPMTLVLVDLGGSQFLATEGHLTALVDTEAYVVGPRELDFIGLEYQLDAETVRPFLAGYRSLLPPPSLSSVRSVYRYLYRLLGVEGDIDWDEWMAQPALFA